MFFAPGSIVSHLLKTKCRSATFIEDLQGRCKDGAIARGEKTRQDYRRISSCTQIVTRRLTTILKRIYTLLCFRCAIIVRVSREHGRTDSEPDSIFNRLVALEAMLKTWTPREGNVGATQEKLCGRSYAGGATREEPCGRSHV